jgi:acyl carrier protein
MEKLENRIAELLAEFEPGEYGPETEILVDLDIDSLDYASVVLTLEEETGISLEERDIDWSDVRSVADLAGLFESKQPTDA